MPLVTMSGNEPMTTRMRFKWLFVRFLPRLARTALETELEQHGIVKPEVTKDVDSLDKRYSCMYSATVQSHVELCSVIVMVYTQISAQILIPVKSLKRLRYSLIVYV